MMQSIARFNVAWKKLLIAGCLLLPILCACGRPGHPASSDVPVSIHAVNYSDEEFEYFLSDPLNESNRGGGEGIGRYAAGGTMCCYSLPKRWHAGLKINLDYKLYFPNPSGGDIRTAKTAAVIDIPQYARPEEIWLVRDAQGAMGIILSNVQPDHPQWPGKVKGWPVPTLAYQRERTDIVIATERSGLKAVQSLLQGMRTSPDQTAKRSWEFAEEYDREAIVGYKGYQDKNYQNFLIEDLEKSVKESEVRLKILEAERP
jgi:hypothetical protein